MCTYSEFFNDKTETDSQEEYWKTEPVDRFEVDLRIGYPGVLHWTSEVWL